MTTYYILSYRYCRIFKITPGVHAQVERVKEYNIYMSKLKHGIFLNVPYDFRRPTVARIQERWWNRNDKRIITPRVFGWGYAINFYQVLRRVGLIRK